ncbi:ATP-dependent RNA helicase DDX42 isoform X1 [Tribolium madens]|uniref:ATP-dependent RNA helicase DDX42 isoform X1 n=1 Tax=Tribolium madens TaxID=41895 RepID=UPI001CF7308E|nr:ATP-dependent RNA helicase DDX42 isoform X1 [Tribolium madens]
MSGFNYSGFQMNQKRHNAVPPPPLSGVSKQGYSTMNAISQNALSAAWGGSRKRAATEDEYFEDDEEETVPDLAYIPAPGSPTRVETKKQEVPNEDDDPLDAYMAGIEKQVSHNTTNSLVEFMTSFQMQSEKPGSSSQQTGVRNDLEEEDVEESYYRYMEENPNAGLAPVEEELDIEYDEDGNPIPPDKKKIIDPLPPIDHSTIEYKPFEKNFYNEHPEIASLSNKQVAELRKTFDITVSGSQPPKPVSSFAHFNFDDKLLKAIIKAEYISPTPIQAQAVPCALQGRDVLGIAQTGSGKTAAFLWPLLKHVSTQPPVSEGEGPAGLILAPTRELAIQIYNEAKKFARVYDLSVVCAYGGGSKWEQSLALKEGADIVVATPGRIIDHVKGGATNLQRVTFLVLDEADRMFELGFEPQVRSVCNHVRPDRQTLLFSATFRKRIEKLAKDALNDPVRISQGITGQANEDVTQKVLLMENQQLKRDWLVSNLVELLSAGSVLVFVTKKVDAEQLANDLKVKEFECLLLHGDIEQAERNKVITAFKKKECSLLVATDVAARGLDIPHIRTVVNYDIARDIDTHTHRIGRTGRAGNQGTAYTLITPKDKEFVGHIVKNLEAAHQDVPQEVLDLALQSAWYRKQRYKSKGGNPNVGGVGLGFKEKVGGASRNFVGETHSQSRGPATDRLSAMKAAFKAQYMNQFTASSDPVPQAPPSTRKKSRWQ